ncbi:MAG: DUF4232 domain-containing protein [Actinobacteria bacterium]|nr:DUF4232 domain-containing protein [Actinomycetota bacterium]
MPAAIPGDPAEGMGKQAWNVVFRDTAGTACSLRGWPAVTVRTPAGQTVVTRVKDVRFSNLAVIPDAPVILAPGQSAVVTAMSPTAPPGCVARWSLGLTLPGTSSRVTVRPPVSSVTPCAGGQLQLSPFYAEQTLTSQIRDLTVSAAPPPFTATTAPEPPVCRAAALRADVASAVSGRDGTVIQLRLANAGATCVLPDGWPTVRLREAGGVSQVAKLLADGAALAAEKSLLTTYERGTTQSTALTLRPGQSVSVALLAAGTGARACRRLVSLTVYPSPADRGAGRTAPVTAPVSICGSPQILSYLPGGPGARPMAIARAALGAARGDPAGKPAGRRTGFYYGTDSSAPTACGRGPYAEPAGSCANGTHGLYGEYIGMVGAFMNWKGCTTSGLAWNQANYNMANDNFVRYHAGLGAAGYWFAAGPGRDPHYSGTTAEAAAWGQQQARQFLSAASGLFFNFRYVFLDIENNGTAPDGNGWNTVWNGPCGNRIEAWYIAPQVDYATFTGFTNYIDAHSPYLAGVYSAGTVSYGSWIGIFGGEQIRHTAEWTFVNEQSGLNFPWGFSGSSSSPVWFGGAPNSCHLMWQWSGGNGVINGYGDFDQADAGNYANPSCQA